MKKRMPWYIFPKEHCSLGRHAGLSVPLDGMKEEAAGAVAEVPATGFASWMKRIRIKEENEGLAIAKALRLNGMSPTSCSLPAISLT